MFCTVRHSSFCSLDRKVQCAFVVGLLLVALWWHCVIDCNGRDVDGAARFGGVARLGGETRYYSIYIDYSNKVVVAAAAF